MSQAADYGSGLFDCFSDIPSCLYGTFLIGCLNADNTAKIEGVGCGFRHLYCPVSPINNRQWIRRRKHMREEFLKDCCVICCCTCCAICQDSRELRNGFGISPPNEYYFGQKVTFTENTVFPVVGYGQTTEMVFNGSRIAGLPQFPISQQQQQQQGSYSSIPENQEKFDAPPPIQQIPQGYGPQPYSQQTPQGYAPPIQPTQGLPSSSIAAPIQTPPPGSSYPSIDMH